MRKTFPLLALGLALLLWVVPARSFGEDTEKDEGKETKITLADVPAKAQATLKKYAEGVEIVAVDKEEKDGKTVYEADVKINDKNYEIVVAENGDLIHMKLDMEEGAKDKKGEKGEKDEKK